MIGTLIIGGGAAGLYLASFLDRAVILESEGIPGRKLLLTGGGRCNYTNTASAEETARRMNGNKAFIRHVLHAHTSADIIARFKALGIEPEEEDNGRIFPRHGSAEDILSALLSSKPEIITGKAVKIERNDSFFTVHTDHGTLRAERIVAATGGMSYPQTGSDGNGYALLASLGHTVRQPYPALSPILLTPSLGKAEGVSVRARLRTGRHEEEGDIIITRRGISGPAALNISRFLADDPALTISFAEFDREKLRMEGGGKLVKNALPIPPRLSEALLGCIAEQRCGNLSKTDLEVIRTQLTRFTAEGRAIEAGAMNTRGGIAAEEIDARTMESKIVKNLYIIGDLIDVDGPTGGYSLTWAFATAYIASAALS